MLADRRVKIVATIGPSISSRSGLSSAIQAGMNVARLNFSHGSQEVHKQVIDDLRAVSQELKAPIGILQDLQGPKIRVGRFKDGQIQLNRGDRVVISPDFELGESGRIPTDFVEIPRSVDEGTRILLDDGLMEMRVVAVEGNEVQCEVVYGGVLKDRKGINLPGADLPVECLTVKDLDDLEFGLAQGVDYVALSFVRKGSDIRKLRELVDAKNPATKVVAKIEMLEALENLEEIIECSDAVMVARGDLAVEVGQTQLPGAQKRIISLCNQIGRPVITATQMLDSMVENPRPTRAEITDVANAVIDGSDALMLSAESASGKHPFKCIKTMHEIIFEVERTGNYFYDFEKDATQGDVASAIGASACLTAQQLEASAIVCLTTTGKTAAHISGFRPRAKIIAVTHLQDTLNRLELVWGVQTLNIRPYRSTDEAMNQIESLLLDYGLVHPGDRVVLTLGVPVLEHAKTNSLRVYTIGEADEDKPRLPREQLPLRCHPDFPISN